MDQIKLDRILARVKEIPKPTLNDFVQMEEVVGAIPLDEGGRPRVKFSQLRFLVSRVISRLGEEYKVTPEEIGELPPDHPIFTQAMGGVTAGGLPTVAAGGSNS